jgi:diguanylate cyclase (GGDEF)-like protein
VVTIDPPLIIVLAVVALVVIVGIALAPQAATRRGGAGRTAVPIGPTGRADADPQADGPGQVTDAERTGSGAHLIDDRVIRVVSAGFLIAVLAIVFQSARWQDAEPAIFTLLVVGFAFVLLVHDLLPSIMSRTRALAVEAVFGMGFVALLVHLTGGPESPFFFGFVLIAVAAALVARWQVAVAVAASVSFLHALVVATFPGSDAFQPFQLSQVALDLVTLWLLTFLGAMVGGQLRRARDAALHLSQRDPLTQLYNRNHFVTVMESEIQRASRTSRGFCLLMLDLDGLKPINDTYGHHYGDRMLRAVADAITAGVRKIDSAARYGGDEFVIILPETEPEGGLVVAEKLRQSVARIRVAAGQQPLPTSVSIGVVSYPGDGETIDQLLMSADAAMYESKRLGRNRVVDRHGGIATTNVNAPGATITADVPAAEGVGPRRRARRRAQPMMQPDRDGPDDDPDPDGVGELGDDRPGEGSSQAPPPPGGTRPSGGRAGRTQSPPAGDARYFEIVRGENDEQFDRGMRGLLGEEPGTRARQSRSRGPADRGA